MAELPGWDRGRLATAEPRDIEAARWHVYARARAPEVRIDIEGRIRSLQMSELEGAAHRLRAAQERRDELRRLEEAKKHQAELRAILELDVADEPEPDEGAG